MSRHKPNAGAGELEAINRRRDVRRKTIPALAQAGPARREPAPDAKINRKNG